MGSIGGGGGWGGWEAKGRTKLSSSSVVPSVCDIN